METLTRAFHRQIWGCDGIQTSGVGAWIAKAGDQHRCDIYVAYTGLPELHTVGFLVTARGDVNELVAFCPIAARAHDSDKHLLAELYQQLKLAVRIAESPESARDTAECIWLGWVGRDGQRAAPHWLYGLSCALLTESWDGSFVHPQPFCPQRFRAMAEQPKAVRWMQRQQKQNGQGKRDGQGAA